MRRPARTDFSPFLTSGVDMGDRDTDYIKQYRRALLNGRPVIAVVAKDDDDRNKARQILKTRGARFITFFGRFVTEVLEGWDRGAPTTPQVGLQNGTNK